MVYGWIYWKWIETYNYNYNINNKTIEGRLMFDKLLGKKEKGIQIFNLPEKKYCHDSKRISKMDKKQLVDVIGDMEKYIGTLSEKLELGKKEYERALQRSDELQEKSNVLSGEMAKVGNEHEELQVKFSNLQNSLEYMTQDRETSLKAEIKFIETHALTKQKVKDFLKVFEVYHGQIAAWQKVSQQNKQLKERLSAIQQEYHQLSEKYNQSQAMMQVRVADKTESPNTSNDNDQDQEDKQNVKEQQGKVNGGGGSQCGQCRRLECVLEGKQQIIMSLNKQIAAERIKLQENSDQLEELNSDLEQILKKVEAKDEQLAKWKLDNSDMNNTIQQLKKNQARSRTNQQKTKQELKDAIKTCELHQAQLAKLNQKLAILQESSQKAQTEVERLKGQVERKQNQLENTGQKLKLYEQQLVEMSRASHEAKQKQTILEETRAEVERQKSRREEIKKQLESAEEQYQIKIKKQEICTNQERIKAEALKRSLTNLETQEEDNRKKLDAMYQEKIQQDGKILQMQKKLKEYKHLIQYLKKEKIELEKTFETKIKNMEELVIQNEEVEDVTDPKMLSASKELPCLSPSPRYEAPEEQDKEIIVLQKKIAQLQEQIDMLKQQNMGLKLQKGQLEQVNGELQANLKSLSLKREQAMRQIKKMSSLGTIEVVQPKPKPNTQESKTKQKQKQKKVAEKAYKGFDILAKLLSTLYKQFISLHVNQIARKQVKDIESSINSIVRKSLDMKDIFQDYI